MEPKETKWEGIQKPTRPVHLHYRNHSILYIIHDLTSPTTHGVRPTNLVLHVSSSPPSKVPHHHVPKTIYYSTLNLIWPFYFFSHYYSSTFITCAYHKSLYIKIISSKKLTSTRRKERERERGDKRGV